MTRLGLGSIAALLALAACSGEAPQNAAEVMANAEDNADAGMNYQAEVLALNDVQRNGVLMRALLDADLPCEAVVKSERLEDQQGNPTWRATCKEGNQHVVWITRDGTAHTLSRPPGR